MWTNCGRNVGMPWYQGITENFHRHDTLVSSHFGIQIKAKKKKKKKDLCKLQSWWNIDTVIKVQKYLPYRQSRRQTTKTFSLKYWSKSMNSPHIRDSSLWVHKILNIFPFCFFFSFWLVSCFEINRTRLNDLFLVSKSYAGTVQTLHIRVNCLVFSSVMLVTTIGTEGLNYCELDN